MGTVRLDRSAATIVAVCATCGWRAIAAGRRREEVAYMQAEAHAMTHGDLLARKAHQQYRRRRRDIAC